MSKNFYIAVYLDDKQHIGNIKEIGFWHNYFVYEIEDTLASRLEFLKIRCIPMPKEVAHGWKFTDLHRPFIVIRDQALSMYGFSKEETEFHNVGKRRYVMTEEDKKNGVSFAKLVLKEEIYRKSKNLWEYTKNNYSDIYQEYFSYVYGTDDKNFITAVENKYPKAVRGYKNKFLDMEFLVEKMYKAEEVVDSIKDCADVRAATGFLYDLFNSLAETIEKDKKTKNENQKNFS